MKIQLILDRDSHLDTIHSTGVWTRGQTKEVDDLTAKRLLKHGDTWAESEADATGKIEGKREKPDDSKMQQTYDLINAMVEKDQVRDFIKTQFNLPVDMRSYRTLDGIKTYAIQLADQYGVLA